MTYLLSILITISIFMTDAMAMDVYFSPKSECEDQIISRINRSRKSILGIVYAINNTEIVSALIRAHERGIKIQILTDRLQAFNAYSKVYDLHEAGIDIKIHSKYKIEHNKFAVFDGNKMETGSFNWTNPAQHKNSENCMFFGGKAEQKNIRPFSDRFVELWAMNSQAKSDAYFVRLRDRRGF